jgi:hypothetical protein
MLHQDQLHVRSVLHLQLEPAWKTGQRFLTPLCCRQTLLADETAVYDPRDPNDRMLLGVKGTISEAELFTLRCRLHEGRWNKARRGELGRSLPVGYVRTETGEGVKDPDRQVQARLEYIFRLFAKRKVARQVLVQLVQEKLKIPAKIWGGPHHGTITWKDPDFSDLIRLLHNPIYAGAYDDTQGLLWSVRAWMNSSR